MLQKSIHHVIGFLIPKRYHNRLEVPYAHLILFVLWTWALEPVKWLHRKIVEPNGASRLEVEVSWSRGLVTQWNRDPCRSRLPSLRNCLVASYNDFARIMPVRSWCTCQINWKCYNRSWRTRKCLHRAHKSAQQWRGIGTVGEVCGLRSNMILKYANKN